MLLQFGRPPAAVDRLGQSFQIGGFARRLLWRDTNAQFLSPHETDTRARAQLRSTNLNRDLNSPRRRVASMPSALATHVRRAPSCEAASTSSRIQMSRPRVRCVDRQSESFQGHARRAATKNRSAPIVLKAGSDLTHPEKLDSQVPQSNR